MAKSFLPLHSAQLQQVTKQTNPEVESSNESLEKGTVDSVAHRSGTKTNDDSRPNEPNPQLPSLPNYTRSLDVYPEEDLERVESQTSAPTKEIICCHKEAFDGHHPNLPIAVAVPIGKPQDRGTGDDSKRAGKNSPPSNSTKTSKAMTPPEPRLPKTSPYVRSVELAPAFRCVLAVLFIVTIVLAWATVGTLFVKGIVYNHMDEW